MRFLITMNMPSYSNNLVHQMTVEHDSKSLEDFLEALSANEFLVVEEFYKDPRVDADYYSRGHVALNYRYVGKVKVLTHRRANEQHSPRNAQ